VAGTAASRPSAPAGSGADHHLEHLHRHAALAVVDLEHDRVRADILAGDVPGEGEGVGVEEHVGRARDQLVGQRVAVGVAGRQHVAPRDRRVAGQHGAGDRQAEGAEQAGVVLVDQQQPLGRELEDIGGHRAAAVLVVGGVDIALVVDPQRDRELVGRGVEGPDLGAGHHVVADQVAGRGDQLAVGVELQALEALDVAGARQGLDPREVDELEVEVRHVDRVVGLAGDVEPAVAVEGDAGELTGARREADRLREGVVLGAVLVQLVGAARRGRGVEITAGVEDDVLRRLRRDLRVGLVLDPVVAELDELRVGRDHQVAPLVEGGAVGPVGVEVVGHLAEGRVREGLQEGQAVAVQDPHLVGARRAQEDLPRLEVADIDLLEQYLGARLGLPHGRLILRGARARAGARVRRGGARVRRARARGRAAGPALRVAEPPGRRRARVLRVAGRCARPGRRVAGRARHGGRRAVAGAAAPALRAARGVRRQNPTEPSTRASLDPRHPRQHRTAPARVEGRRATFWGGSQAGPVRSPPRRGARASWGVRGRLERSKSLADRYTPDHR
jgi:hypothetical protein